MGNRNGLITGSETKAVRTGGVNARFVQVMMSERTDVQNVQLVEQAGEESHPPIGSLATIATTGQAFKQAVGAHDGVTPIMERGGKRIYSIDPDTHEAIAEVRLYPDGSILVTSPGATIEISAAGALTINCDGAAELTAASATINCDLTVNGDIDSTGTVTAPSGAFASSLSFEGIDGGSHVHVETDSITNGPQNP